MYKILCKIFRNKCHKFIKMNNNFLNNSHAYFTFSIIWKYLVCNKLIENYNFHV